ncbi:MAG: outer membrane beta-barrel protein [Bacteroidales bacterium]|nr:outer membrane beta-barrel protein [Bacteroidales bacterium]
MKKIFLTIFAALVMVCGVSVNSNAQNEFYVGTLGLNFGLGCGTVNHAENHWNNIFLPSFNFAADYSFLPNVINSNGSVSGGLYFGIGSGSRTEYQSLHKRDVKFSDFCWRIGTRGALHYTWVRNLDTYAGVAFGMKHQTYKRDYVGENEVPKRDETDFDSYGFGGARYKFNQSVAVFSEVATTHYAWFQIGVSVMLQVN